MPSEKARRLTRAFTKREGARRDRLGDSFYFPGLAISGILWQERCILAGGTEGIILAVVGARKPYPWRELARGGNACHLDFRGLEEKGQVGFEPTYDGFANHCPS